LTISMRPELPIRSHIDLCLCCSCILISFFNFSAVQGNKIKGLWIGDTLEELKGRSVPSLTHSCGFLCWLCLLWRDYGTM
jgi:hypothetical protein